jgi:dipeptidyl aminopeptidase/acylaminoacyl peptidase
MQDDITDGTRWLVTQKLADPRRICIVGASFGGYAALMGAVKEPDLYACAAAFAPVTDLDSLVNRLRMFAFKDLNLPRIKSDGQSLSATSPVDHADAIRVPVLLMHGREDFTVPVDHSEEMERALRRAGKPVQAIYLEHADHYFASGKDRTAWLTALDSFLAAALAER